MRKIDKFVIEDLVWNYYEFLQMLRNDKRVCYKLVGQINYSICEFLDFLIRGSEDNDKTS